MVKGLGIGCLVIIIILFFVGCATTLLVVSTSDDSGSDGGDNTTEETTEEVLEEETLLQIGDSATIDDITVTVNGVRYTDERNQYYEGHVDSVIIIDLTYANNTDSDIPVGTDFDVYADGAKMDTYPVDMPLFESLSAGRTVDGSLAYGIVGNPTLIELEFEPMLSFFNSEKAIFDITP